MRRATTSASGTTVILVLLLAAGTAWSQRATHPPADTYVLGPVGVTPPQAIRLNMVNAGPATCHVEWKLSAFNFDPRFQTAVEELTIGGAQDLAGAGAAYQSTNGGFFYSGLECLLTGEPNCMPAIVAQVKVRPALPGTIRVCAVSSTLEVIQDGRTKVIVQPTTSFREIPTPGDPPPR